MLDIQEPSPLMSPALKTGGEEKPEVKAVCGEIILFCHAHNVEGFVEALNMGIEQSAGELPLSVIWSGKSCGLGQGVIILQCDGNIPPDFVYNLSIDHEVFDYVVYTYVVDELTQNGSSQVVGCIDDVEMGGQRR